MLSGDEFATERDALDQAFASRSLSEAGAGTQFYGEVRQLTSKLQAKLKDQGYALPLGTPEEFAAFVSDESKRWGEVIRRANIKME